MVLTMRMMRSWSSFQIMWLMYPVFLHKRLLSWVIFTARMKPNHTSWAQHFYAGKADDVQFHLFLPIYRFRDSISDKIILSASTFDLASPMALTRSKKSSKGALIAWQGKFPSNRLQLINRSLWSVPQIKTHLNTQEKKQTKLQSNNPTYNLVRLNLRKHTENL